MTENSTRRTIRFTAQDLELFSRASHDYNPLHLSESYARTTQYGQRVVFGVLGGLFCLSTVEIPAGSYVSAITFDFQSPMFIGLDYQLESEWASATRIVTRLTDGSTVLVKGTLQVATGELIAPAQNTAQPELYREAAQRPESDFGPALSSQARYNVEQAAFRALLERTGLAENIGIAEAQLEALLWSSYLVGMELPGQQALFSWLSIKFESGRYAKVDWLDFSARVKGYDTRFNLLNTEAELRVEDTPFAKVQIQAFFRQSRFRVAGTKLQDLITNPLLLKGKVGLVIGASRGLGAALTQALALQGCTVLANYQHSQAEAEKLRESMSQASGKVILKQGDGSSPEWCRHTSQQILEEYGQLDFLICNASPAILPMKFEAQTVERLNAYVQQSLALYSVPLAHFMNLLVEDTGRVVVISSIYAEKLPANFPHYVSAKLAIEGLVKTIATTYKDYSFLIARPPRLIGELNLPFGDELVLSAEQVAITITSHLQKLDKAQGVEFLSDFQV